MDEIKKEINNAIVRNAAYQFTKSDIKRLIELVENEQEENCLHAIGTPEKPKKVSQKIDWEEL